MWLEISYTQDGGPPLKSQLFLESTNSPARSLEGLGLRRKESTTSTKQATAMVQGWELVKAEKNNAASFVERKQSCGGDAGNEDRIEFYKTGVC